MKIYIAEDEPLAAAKLKFFLEKLGEGGDVSLFDNGVSLLAAIGKDKPDLLFLDIQMPGMTGMQVLERISGIQVIVSSAFDRYALESFRFQVADYLLKPYTLERLQLALGKARENIRLKQLDQQINAARLTVRVDGRSEIILQSDILYIEAMKDYVRIFCLEGTRSVQRLTMETLGGIGEMLDDRYFIRVHRSYIVNLRQVTGFDSQQLELTTGTKVPVGKTYRNTIREQLKL